MFMYLTFSMTMEDFATAVARLLASPAAMPPHRRHRI